MPSPKQHDQDRNLYQRGQIWWCRYELGGREQRESLGTSNVRAARKARDRILAEVVDRRAGRAPEVVHTWQEAVDGYLALASGHAATGRLSPKTTTRYETSIVQVTSAVAGDPDEAGHTRPIPLSDISRATLLDFVEARREEERATSTILNDITAISRVLAYAAGKGWIEHNVARDFDRRMFVGSQSGKLDPPDDGQVEAMAAEVAIWSSDLAVLIRWLRDTGMRLAEALAVRREDVHPDGLQATLRRGVKRGRVRTILLGRAAALLPGLPAHGRLFGGLHADSAVVSTRYGQWRRQRQAREDRAADGAGRPAEALVRFRLHDLRHAFAIASVIDDDTCLRRLRDHLGHSSIKTTEMYERHLRAEGAMARYARRLELFGSLSG
jgi:integrase